MNELKFNCPSCGQRLAADHAAVGSTIQCPACEQTLQIPANPAATSTPLASGLRFADAEKTPEPQVGTAPDAPTKTFCTNCGKPVSAGNAFCGACGAATGPARSRALRPAPAAPSSSGLPETLAGGLCYLGFWVTGLVFLVIDKRPFVRFHAAQSIFTFVGLSVLWVVLGQLAGMAVSMQVHSSLRALQANPLQPPTWSWMGYFGYLHTALWLIAFLIWMICMVSAFLGGRYHVPIAGDIAEGIARKG